MTTRRPVALVTGATGGIGRAVVRALATHDRVVVATDLDPGALDQHAQQWTSQGLAVRPVVADLTTPDDMANLIGIIAADFGHLDILVNNAGVTGPARVERMTDDQWDRVLDVNLSVAFRLCRAAAGLLGIGGPPPAGHRKIVNIASTNGIYGQAHNTNYSASKAGLVGFTRALAREWAPARVNVNAVAPGFIAGTGMTRESSDPRAGLPAATLKALEAQMPMGRAGAPDDVAGAVRFLAGADSDFITGQVLEVHGGKEFITVVDS